MFRVWAFRSFRAQGFECFGFQSWGGFKDLFFSKNEAALDFPVWLGECRVQGVKFCFSSFYVLSRYPDIAPINTHPIIPIQPLHNPYNRDLVFFVWGLIRDLRAHGFKD